MANSIVNNLKCNADFTELINSRFKKPIERATFSSAYSARKAPNEFLKTLPEIEARNIVERELIRDNIFLKYKFDIFEYPIVLFYQNGKSREMLKPFRNTHDAAVYASSLLGDGVPSLIISIMNHTIECKLFSN